MFWAQVNFWILYTGTFFWKT